MKKVRCSLCGADGDGQDGWSEDHHSVCLLAEKPCPARSYGCTAMIPKFQVGAHLRTSCPVAVSPCRLRRHKSTWNRFVNSDLLGGVYNSSAKMCSGSECCGARLRRLDLEQHYLFTHPDYSLVEQGCPYTLSVESVLQFRTAETRSSATRPLLLEAASPLYPPRDGVERKSKFSSAKGSSHSACKPSLSMQSDGASRKCSFERKQLVPIFPKLLPQKRAESRSGSLDSSVRLVFEKQDLMFRILDSLDCTALQVFACVCKTARASCDDPTLKFKRNVVSLAWKRSQDGDACAVKWCSTCVWERPSLSPPILRWSFSTCALGMHMQSCTAKHSARSMEEMLTAAESLGTNLKEATSDGGILADLMAARRLACLPPD
jgi:hypothetical protein